MEKQKKSETDVYCSKGERMELYNNNIILRDRTGIVRVIVGDISCTPSSQSPDINVKTQIPTAPEDNEPPIEWSEHDKPIIEIWDSLTTEQKQSIEQVIRDYQDEIFSLGCQIAENGWY
ncbi:hypothetical protein [Xenorhabdus szentirmaii]|uniref:hypothetical protein n=1 Tax=Xenorhabdus szentirmaii TaxID=290112 RepID=UPI00117C79BE|nr:hypothetical protein [Xenorhabdus szentirmaii]